MKKRVLALILAGVMTFGGSITAFAADTTVDNSATSEATVTGTGTVNTPTIKVTVPTTFAVVLNPFQIAYEDTAGNIQKTQIVTVPQIITNESNVAVALNVSEFTATPANTVTLISKTVGRATDKSVYLYLDIVNCTSDDASTAKFSGSGLTPSTGDADPAKKDAVVTLAIGDETPTYAAFKLGGDMVVNPVDTDGNSDPWTASDKVDVSIKFTFTPQMGSSK